MELELYEEHKIKTIQLVAYMVWNERFLSKGRASHTRQRFTWSEIKEQINGLHKTHLIVVVANDPCTSLGIKHQLGVKRREIFNI